MDNKIKYFVSPDVLSQDIDNEVILLDLKKENYFGMNEVGAAIFEILKDGANFATLIDRMLKVYDVEEEQLSMDIAHLLTQLLEAGIIYTLPES